MNIITLTKSFKGWKRNIYFIKKKRLLIKRTMTMPIRKHTKMQEAYHAAKSMNERFRELQQKESAVNWLVRTTANYGSKEQQLG